MATAPVVATAAVAVATVALAAIMVVVLVVVVAAEEEAGQSSTLAKKGGAVIRSAGTEKPPWMDTPTRLDTAGTVTAVPPTFIAPAAVRLHLDRLN